MLQLESATYGAFIKVRPEPVTPMLLYSAKGVGVARAHNLLSRHKYILYTTQYSSHTLVYRKGERAVRLCVACKRRWW